MHSFIKNRFLFVGRLQFIFHTNQIQTDVHHDVTNLASGYHSQLSPSTPSMSRQLDKHLPHSPHAQNHPIVQFEKEINPRYTIGAPEKGIDMTPEDSCFRAFETVSNGRAGGIINQLEIAGTGHANATVTTVNSTSDQQSLQNDARKKGFRLSLGPARSVRFKPKSL